MHRPTRGLFVLVALVPLAAHAETFVRFLPLPVSSTFTVRASIHNKRIDYPVTADVRFVAADGAVSASEQVTIEPQGTAVVPVPQKALATGGSIVVRCEAPDAGPLDPSLIIERKGNSRTAVTVVPGFRRAFGTALEVTAALPTAKTHAYVAVANASNEPRTVTVRTMASTGAEATNVLMLAPQQTIVTDVSPRLAAGAIAIHVEHDGAPGDVAVNGAVVDDDALRALEFTDLAHGLHDHRLRAEFVFLGAPPASYGFAPGTDFTAACILRNTGTSTMTVSPTLRPATGGAPIALAPIMVPARGMATLDLSAEKDEGHIPGNVTLAGLDLAYSENDGRLLGQLICASAAYDLSINLSGHLSSAVAGASWSTATDTATMLGITNAGDQGDAIVLELHHGARALTLPEIPIAPHGSTVVNLRDALLTVGAPADFDSGTYFVRGRNGIHTEIGVQRLVVGREKNGIGGKGGPSAYMLPDGDVRVAGVSPKAGSTSASQPTSPPTGSQRYLTVPLTNTAIWTNGARTNETEWTDFSTDNTAYVTQLVQGASAAATVLVDGQDRSGRILVFYFDPCNLHLSFTGSIFLANKRSAYVFAYQEFINCIFQSTCVGTCSTTSVAFVKVSDSPSCFTPGLPYLQCWDLTVNGVCVLRHIFCDDRSVPGFCT